MVSGRTLSVQGERLVTKPEANVMKYVTGVTSPDSFDERNEQMEKVR